MGSKGIAARRPGMRRPGLTLGRHGAGARPDAAARAPAPRTLLPPGRLARPMSDETPEERRARKAREREENGRKLEAELESQYLRPLPERMSFHECQSEHTRLRMKIMEFQQMVIQGKLDVRKAQELEKRMVAQIHQIEEKARGAGAHGYVPKPGE